MNLILHVLSCHRRWAAFLYAVGFKFFFFIPFTYVLCVSSVGHAMPCLWRLETTFGVVISFFLVSPGDRTQVVRLTSKLLCLLADPELLWTWQGCPSAHEPGVFHSSLSGCLFFICTGERLSSASLCQIVRLEMPLLFLTVSSARAAALSDSSWPHTPSLSNAVPPSHGDRGLYVVHSSSFLRCR